MIITYRYRIKDKHAERLSAQAEAVNIVWNYCNEIQKKAAQSGRKWLSGYELWKLVAGATKEGLDLHSHSAMRVCIQYDASRKQHKVPWLDWRKSQGSRRSLGWVPFNTGHVILQGGAFVFRKKRYDVWLHRPLPKDAKIGAGSFSQDNCGHWYINCPVDVPEATQAINARIGIDLGLKTFATTSDGQAIEMPALYRANEAKLIAIQRARKIKRLRAAHRKIVNRRKDFLHKESTKLVKKFGLIIVGNVSPSDLVQTRMAKSVQDVGWSTFRIMLSWKSRLRGGGMMLEVNERMSTQICSECGCLPTSRPGGIAGLGIREWTCDECGTTHNRDHNAAKNILRLGLETLAEGASHEGRASRALR
jgi:putative transposase